jgi:hypothetical protein
VGIDQDWQIKLRRATITGNFHIATSAVIIHFASVPWLDSLNPFDL